jgi:hypothetical protein
MTKEERESKHAELRDAELIARTFLAEHPRCFHLLKADVVMLMVEGFLFRRTIGALDRGKTLDANTMRKLRCDVYNSANHLAAMSDISTMTPNETCLRDVDALTTQPDAGAKPVEICGDVMGPSNNNRTCKKPSGHLDFHEFTGPDSDSEPERKRPHLIDGEFQSDKYPATPRAGATSSASAARRK